MSQVRQPRATVSLGGVNIVCSEVSVDQTKKDHGGSFTAKFPLGAMARQGLDMSWFTTQAKIPVQVMFSVDDSAGTLMFTGNVEKAEITLDGSGQMVSVSGKDPAAAMKSKKTTEKFTNQQSTDIVKTIAGRNGLGVVTDSGIDAGKIYTAEQAALTHGESEWTYLRSLAEKEGKVLSVIAGQLYYKAADDSSLPMYTINYTPPTATAAAQSNTTKLSLSRNFEAAKTINTKVKSWDHKKQQLVQAQSSVPGAGSDTLEYSYTRGHKTQTQANAHAKGKAGHHARHEFDITIDMPGDVTLTPMFQIQITGTPGFDQQVYAIDHISHKISASGGYTMTISTKAAKKGRKAQ